MRESTIKKLDTKKLSKNSVALMSYGGVLNYLCTSLVLHVGISGFLKDALTEIFGKHNRTYIGEFRNFVWIVEFENERFEIFTASKKGTSYEMDDKDFKFDGNPDAEKSKLCMRFLKEIERLLVDLKLEQLYKRSEELHAIIDKKGVDWDYSRNFNEWAEFIEKENKELEELSRIERLIMPVEIEGEIPSYGDVMSLKEFIENVNCGGFIDYDGSGNYITDDDKVTNISIYPSDVTHHGVRREFKKIIWFNR